MSRTLMTVDLSKISKHRAEVVWRWWWWVVLLGGGALFIEYCEIIINFLFLRW